MVYLCRDGTYNSPVTCGLHSNRAKPHPGVQVLNISCLSDLDVDAILKAANTGRVITYEDHHIQTGLGSLVANVIAEHGLPARLHKMGITRYGSSGKPDDLYRMQGLDVDSLVQAVLDEVERI